MRGYWWAPDGSSLLVAGSTTRQSTDGISADPANPAQPAAEVGYPAAGTPNALVELLIVRPDGEPGAGPMGRGGLRLPHHCLLGFRRSADRRAVQGPAADAAAHRGHRRPARTSVLREDADACWLDIVPGVPARLTDGRIAWTADAGGARRLLVAAESDLADGTAEPVTPADLNVRGILSVDGDTVLVSGSDGESAEIGVWSWGSAGLQPGLRRQRRARSRPGGRHDGPDQPVAWPGTG